MPNQGTLHPDLQIPQRDWEQMVSVFVRFPQIERVYLYGSRARGTAKPYSDIDLTLDGIALTLAVLQEIESALDDLYLPYFFDLSIKSLIRNEDLLHHIQHEGKLIYAQSVQ